jgi:hypothetical protein
MKSKETRYEELEVKADCGGGHGSQSPFTPLKAKKLAGVLVAVVVYGGTAHFMPIIAKSASLAPSGRTVYFEGSQG